MELHLQIIGITLIALALVHIIFPKYFKWKEDLKPLSLVNRQMMQVHTFFIALTVLSVGVLCVFHYNAIINTSLGNDIALGLAVFWGIRFLFQLFAYSPKLWKGKFFETIVHIVFSFLWMYFTIVFLLIFMEY